MSFDGLNAFRTKQESKGTSEQKFYKPKEKGQKVQIRPLVELDSSSINFSEKNGTATFAQEFQNPQKFWLSIIDTRDDEGSSFGWEMVAKYGWYKAENPDVEKGQHSDSKFNWNPKKWVYIPALVKENPDDEPRVEVLQLSYHGDAAQALISFAESADEEGTLRSITDRWWTYSRNGGEGFGVKYAITPRDPSDDVNVEDYDVPNVKEDLLVNIPYGADGSEQAKYLQVASNVERGAAPSAAAPESAPELTSAVAQAKW